MTIPAALPDHLSLKNLIRPHSNLDARRLDVLVALVFAIVQARTVVLYQLTNHLQLPGQWNSRFKRLKRFVQHEISDTQVAGWVLKRLPDGPLYLVMDRTNWKLGQKDVNILFLSAV